MLPTTLCRGARYPEEYGVVQPVIVESDPVAVIARNAPSVAAHVMGTEARLRHLSEGLGKCVETVVEMIRSSRSPESKAFRVSANIGNDDGRLLFSEQERTRCQVVAEFL